MSAPQSTANAMLTRLRGLRAVIAVGLAVVLLVVAMLGLRHVLGGKLLPLSAAKSALKASPAVSMELVSGTDDSLHMPPEVAQQFGIKTTQALKAQLADELQLSGTLTLDAAHLQQVRSRFAGEVVEIGIIADGSRPVQFGDHVAKGQLLAVVWSRELGEKKSELIDALSQSQLDTETLQRLAKLYQDGTIPEHQYRDAERAVETDRIAISRVLRTLRTWRVTDEEIAAIEADAQKLIEGSTKPSSDLTDRWARVELLAALDGVVLEQNATVGDIVSPADDLFKVADLSRFRVLAYAYEEDLPQLDTLDGQQRHWAITVPAYPDFPPQSGIVEQIGHLIDPAQHTALVLGWVDNPLGNLRAGQFIAATISLPAPDNEVVLPASALIEKGGEKLIFVKTASDPIFTRRSVSLSRQVGDKVCLHIVPPPIANQPIAAGVQPDEEVVISGAVELQQALSDLLADRSQSSGK